MKQIGLGLVTFFFVMCTIGDEPAVAKSRIEPAVQSGDWDKVARILETEDVAIPGAVSRLLMGHATLALNRNNASVLLFLSVDEQTDIASWAAWTDQLSVRHNTNPVALYLAADAMARSGEFAVAIKGFTRALEVAPSFALARNARGVVYVSNGQWDEALVDFYTTMKIAPDFADAFANFGTLAVLQEASLQVGGDAVRAFDRAIAINPSFALAMNGKGSLYFGNGDFEAADEHFRAALQVNPLLSFSDLNRDFTFGYAFRQAAVAALDAQKRKALTSITAGYEEITLARAAEPGHLDPTLQKRIDAFAWMSPADRQALINEVGPATVQKGLLDRLEIIDAAIALRVGDVQKQRRDIKNWANWKMVAAIGTTAVSTISTGSDTIRNLRKGQDDLIKGANLEAAKALSDGNLVFRAFEAVTNPVPSIADSGFDILNSVSSDRLAASGTRQQMALQEISFLSAHARAARQGLDLLASMPTQQVSAASNQSVSAYTMPKTVKLHEIAAISSVVNHKLSGNNRVLNIMTPDVGSLRSHLLQSSLNRHGIATRLVEPNADLKMVNRDLKANLFLELPTSPVYTAARTHRLSLPTAPGVISIPNASVPKSTGCSVTRTCGDAITSKPIVVTALPGSPPPPPPNFNWQRVSPQRHLSKEFGIVTDSKAFVDEGNWPVLTIFGLAYSGASQNAVQ